MQAGRMRGEQLLRIWKDAGIWPHPQGELERAMGVNGKPDAREYAARAEQATEFGAAVEWVLSHPKNPRRAYHA
jgi:hypothetical protein